MSEESVDPNLDDIDFSDCKDPIRQSVCRPSPFNADWSLPLIVVIIKSITVFEVIVHKFRVLK